MFALSLLALALGHLPAHALECRLALVLALDVSASVDEDEYNLQRDGLAAALASPAVAKAVFAERGTTIALFVFEWSGHQRYHVIQNWTVIASPAHLRTLAATIHAHQRTTTEFPTAIGPALGYAALTFRRAPPCDQHKIDISGDGIHNDSFPPESAFKAYDFDGITINGLAIGGNSEDVFGYYLRSVIRGPGAFVMNARNHADFERAMELKLIREIEPRQVALTR